MSKLKGRKMNNSKSKHFRTAKKHYNPKNPVLHDDDHFENAEVSTKWYEGFSDDTLEFKPLPEADVGTLRAEAERALENETQVYNNKKAQRSGKSNYEWLRTMTAKGTISDKIAANTILIQNSPVHSIATIRNMVNMVKVGKKKECVMIIETLTELFLTELLVSGRKLRLFEDCPLSLLDQLSSGNRITRTAYLVRWYFEGQLKEVYKLFIQALVAAVHDTVESNKEKAISAMYNLLAGNPEQESILLKNIVNKLGDPSQKVSSKAIYCLTRLLQEHPNMKVVVMEEIEKLLFRPNVSSRGQYYGICFLTQFLLSREDTVLSVGLIKLYFSFFKACLKKGDIDTRLMKAILTGVNRAFPYAQGKLFQIDEHIETVYKIVHIANFTVSLHALCLLHQVCDYSSAITDRFYSALYKKILDPQLSTSSHQAMFLSLVFRALRKDVSDNRVRCFIKRLLQVCLYLPVPLVCGILYLVSQLIHNNKSLEAFALKASQLSSYDDPDEEVGEHYEDVKIEESEDLNTSTNERQEESVEQAAEEEEVKPTWFHCQNLQGTKNKATKVIDQYDSNQRNPLFAGGEFCTYSELRGLSQHYHPTVVLYANKILEGETITYSGDPLQDFTLIRFLDRFVFKNPKKIAPDGKTANMKFSRKWTYQPRGVKSMAVNSASYLNLEESAIPVDELFMYRFLIKKQEEKREEGDDESDADSVASEEFEEMLDKLMGGKEKEIDYADEVGDKLKPSKENDQDSEEDDNDIGSGSDIEEDLDDEDEIEEGSDDDAEDIVFDDDGEEEDIEFDINNLPDDDDDEEDESIRIKKSKKKGFKGGIDRSIFASADEFAEMLQDTGDTNLKLGGLASMSNKDNAGVKQLKWEMSRDHWVKGAQRGKRKGPKSSGRPPKKFKR